MVKLGYFHIHIVKLTEELHILFYFYLSNKTEKKRREEKRSEPVFLQSLCLTMEAVVCFGGHMLSLDLNQAPFLHMHVCGLL